MLKTRIGDNFYKYEALIKYLDNEYQKNCVIKVSNKRNVLEDV